MSSKDVAPRDVAPRGLGLRWVMEHSTRKLFQKLLPPVSHYVSPSIHDPPPPQVQAALKLLCPPGPFCPGQGPVVPLHPSTHPSWVPVPWRSRYIERRLWLSGENLGPSRLILSPRIWSKGQGGLATPPSCLARPAHTGPGIRVIPTQGLKACTPPPWLWALTGLFPFIPRQTRSRLSAVPGQAGARWEGLARVARSLRAIIPLLPAGRSSFQRPAMESWFATVSQSGRGQVPRGSSSGESWDSKKKLHTYFPKTNWGLDKDSGPGQ